IELFVDLRDKEEGSYTVDIEHGKIPSELSVYIDPKTIDVDIEERATEQFPISVDFIDEDKLPVGYELGEAEVKPEVAEVTSAKSVMEQIGIVKVYIDPKTIDVDIEERATVHFPISVDFIDEDKLPVGYELAEAEVKPEVAEVTSTKSVMEQIGIVKVYIDVADLDESVNNRELPIN